MTVTDGYFRHIFTLKCIATLFQERTGIRRRIYSPKVVTHTVDMFPFCHGVYDDCW